VSTRRVLLTGSTGYLGGLIAAALLERDDAELIVPIRAQYDAEGFWGPVRAEVVARTGVFSQELEERVHIVALPPLEAMHELAGVFETMAIDEIVHCAGCVDYFNKPMLEAVNVGFTRDLLALGTEYGVERFTYISSAFSSGYLEGTVPEALHPAAGSDPTDYTRTKREAERAVADSGLPYLILRPPIVIGDSVDGRYSGKRYGVYQFWAGMERLLFAEWHPEIHYVAPPGRPMPLLHQDAFQDAFMAAFKLLPAGSIFNMVPPNCPHLRDVAYLWYADCMAPERIYYYDRLENVPLLEINRRQRAFLGVASTNIEIASHMWEFETGSTAWLREQGADWVETTLGTVAVCQARFKRQSTRIMNYVTNNKSRFERAPEVIELCLMNAS
jgi:nucleoside-diphosphate-sugar epimerase